MMCFVGVVATLLLALPVFSCLTSYDKNCDTLMFLQQEPRDCNEGIVYQRRFSYDSGVFD